MQSLIPYSVLSKKLIYKIEQVESKMHKVLAIETSCDETSVSIVSNIGDTFKIHSNIIASQIDDHSKWGGVVPELAARKHLELLPFVLEKALEESKTKIDEVDSIASTVAPGLVGCLRVGSITVSYTHLRAHETR